MKVVEKLNKMVNLAILVVAMTCVLTMGLVVGLESYSSATNGNELISEEILLEKSKIIEKITKYQKNSEPFFATSKVSKLSNLSIDKLSNLSKRGYLIYITKTKTYKNLPEPVHVEGKKIMVSIYSNDGELIDVINKILENN